MPASDRAAILAWRERELNLALATVVATWGSAPRPVGALLAVDAAGAFEGSVSGGCIEAAVVAEAQQTLEDGKPRLLEYGVSDEDAFAVGLACGGEIKVFAQRLDDALAEVLVRIEEQRGQRRACVACTDISSGQAQLFLAADESEVAQAAWQQEQAGLTTIGGKQYFIEPQRPPLRLLIIGAVHIAQSLVQLAQQLDIETIVIDPRTAWATEARFPGTQLVCDWPDRALQDIELDSYTAVATLTHDPKIDDVALKAVLESEVFYIGSLGSRKTHAQRLERLTAAGVDAAKLERIQAPIGLDIGARSAAEIALAVIAQVVEVRPRP